MKKNIPKIIIFVAIILLTMWFTRIPTVDTSFYAYPIERLGNRPVRITSHPDLPFVLINDRSIGTVITGFESHEIVFRGVFFEYYLVFTSTASLSIVTDNGDEYSLMDALSTGIVTIYEVFQSGLDVHRRVSPNPEFIFRTVLLLIFAYTQISKLINLTLRGGNPLLSSLKRFQARPNRGG